MKTRRFVVASAVAVAILVLVGGPARADNVSIGVSTPSGSFGLNIGSPPPLVAVPSLLVGPASLLFAAAVNGVTHQARLLAGIVARS